MFKLFILLFSDILLFDTLFTDNRNARGCDILFRNDSRLSERVDF